MLPDCLHSINGRVDSTVLNTLLSPGVGWGDSRALYWVTSKLCWQWLFCHWFQQDETSFHLHFYKRACSLLRLCPWAMPCFKQRTETACWHSDSNQMHRSAWPLLLVHSFPLSYFAIAIRETISPPAAREDRVVHSLTCPLMTFDLWLWTATVFLKEEVVYKKTRRTAGVLVPHHYGYRQSLKP